MKKTIFALVLIPVITVFTYTVFGFGENSNPVTIGQINACWSPACELPQYGQVVYLLSVNSDVRLDSCILYPANDCCKMAGDFHTGTYYFVYHRVESQGVQQIV
jgi:hypothetical protein